MAPIVSRICAIEAMWHQATADLRAAPTLRGDGKEDGVFARSPRSFRRLVAAASSGARRWTTGALWPFSFGTGLHPLAAMLRHLELASEQRLGGGGARHNEAGA